MANTMIDVLKGFAYGYGLRLGELSPLGRVFAMLLGKHGDTVPFMGPQIHDHAMTIARVPARKYYFEADLMVDVQIAVERWYGFDSYTIIPDAYNFEVEALGAKMIYSDIAMPTVDHYDPLIKPGVNLDKLGSLDITKGRIPMGVEAARLISEKVEGPLAVGFFCSPFSFICQAMGYAPAIRALRKDKVYAQELFDFAENQAIFPYLEAQSKQPGVKQSAGADAWAAFPNLTPDLVEEWVVPSAERMAKRGKKELGMSVLAGAAACDYCEEDPSKFDKEIMFQCWTTARKTMLLDVALSAMGRTQDWDMSWMQEFALREKGLLGKLPIFASLNGRFMRDSRPDRIVDKIREWIDLTGRDGRLLFFIGNVPADTPPINISTSVEAVHQLGRYPIAEDLFSVEVSVPELKPFDEWLRGQPEEEIILKARQEDTTSVFMS